MKVPIAETFHSLQGEGTWTGTPMFFIRLAGCTVGKFPSTTDPNAELPTLKTGKVTWKCHTWDNRPFWCDTDFNKYEEHDTGDLLKVPEEHICLTGGEPLMHQPAVSQILEWGKVLKKRIHIETSGTINRWWYPQEWAEKYRPWVAVSPKLNATSWMMKRADEIKLLVDKSFALDSLPSVILDHENVFLQPINAELAVDRENLDRVMKLLKTKPNFKLSVQMHKLLQLR